MPVAFVRESLLQGRVGSKARCNVCAAYQFTVPPTSTRTLERAWHIGREAGLEFVYVGNVPGHRYDNTHCPQCLTLLIERRGFEVTYNGLNHGRCLWCQRAIAGVWQ